MKLNKKFWDRFQILFYEYDYQKLAKMVSRGCLVTDSNLTQRASMTA